MNKSLMYKFPKMKKWSELSVLLFLFLTSCVYRSMDIFNIYDDSWCSSYPLPYLSDAKWRQTMTNYLSSPDESDRREANLYFRHIDRLKQCSQTLQSLSFEEMVSVANKLYDAFSSSFESKGVNISDITSVRNYISNSQFGYLNRFIQWDIFYNSLPLEIRKGMPEEEAHIIFDMHCARILLQYIEQNENIPDTKRVNARNMAYFILNKSDGECGYRAYMRTEFNKLWKAGKF